MLQATEVSQLQVCGCGPPLLKLIELKLTAAAHRMSDKTNKLVSYTTIICLCSLEAIEPLSLIYALALVLKNRWSKKSPIEDLTKPN